MSDPGASGDRLPVADRPPAADRATLSDRGLPPGAAARPRPLHHRLRSFWRLSIRARWRSVRGPLLLTVAVTSMVLGTIGYLQLRSVSPRYGFLDALYRAITLFAFGGAATPPIPVTLQIARIAAPLLTGYAALGTVLALTRAQVRVLGIRLLIRRHVIICGLGETGGRLATALVDRSPVVVIESDAAAKQLAGARLRGVSVLGGDASDPALLRQAGIERASVVIVTCGSAAVNVDVTAAVRRASTPRRAPGRHASSRRRRRHPLSVLANVADLDLWSSLATEGQSYALSDSRLRLQFFNLMSNGAQLLVEREPPFAPGGLGSAHVLIVGVHGIGEQLVLALARLTANERPDDDTRLRVTFTGSEAAADVQRLLGRYPALAGYLELGIRQLAIDSAEFAAGAAMLGDDGEPDVTRAYVTLSNEASGLQAALALHSAPRTRGIPVAVAVNDAAAGISGILRSDRGRLAGITAFGAISETTDHRLLFRGINEMVARAQHAQWLRHLSETEGAAANENPNFKPWDELSEAQKEFNRRFADDIDAKLELIGCILVPMPLPDPTDRFRFTDEELELLARQEHERWMAERLSDGWVWGRDRDDERKINDALKPYDELDEVTQDKDRAAVREIPVTLAAAGFAIRRT